MLALLLRLVYFNLCLLGLPAPKASNPQSLGIDEASLALLIVELSNLRCLRVLQVLKPPYGRVKKPWPFDKKLPDGRQHGDRLYLCLSRRRSQTS